MSPASSSNKVAMEDGDTALADEMKDFYGSQRVFLGDGPTVPRIEPFSPAVWMSLPSGVRIALVFIIILAFVLPICVGYIVNNMCNVDQRVESHRHGSGGSSESDTNASHESPCGQDTPCKRSDGFGFFVDNWLMVYLRIGFVCARLVAIIVIHYWNFPTEESYNTGKNQKAHYSEESVDRGNDDDDAKEEEGETRKHNKNEDPWWAIFVPSSQRSHPVARDAWIRSTIFFGTVSLYLFSHMILNYMWHAMYGCANDPDSARSVLIYSLGSAIALLPLLAEADVYSAAAIGIYVASLIYTLLVTSDASAAAAAGNSTAVGDMALS